MNAKPGTESGERRAVSLGWLSTHSICAVYGLSLVPGFEYLLLAVIASSVLIAFLIKTQSGRSVILITVVLAAAMGFAVRKLSYEAHGLTATSFLLTMAVVVASVFAGYFVFFREKTGASTLS